jgi:hypothetical protein
LQAQQDLAPAEPQIPSRARRTGLTGKPGFPNVEKS